MNLHPDSQPLTAFVTPWGLYEWTVLRMGLKTAPSAYQRLVVGVSGILLGGMALSRTLMMCVMEPRIKIIQIRWTWMPH